MDHKSDFILLVMKKIGKEISDKIEWSGTRLICIASDFTKYDQHAVFQIGRNIELIRYKLFGSNLLLLELVNAFTGNDEPAQSKPNATKSKKTYSYSPKVESAPMDLQHLNEKVKSFILAQGDDVQEKKLKLYTAYKRIRNFLCLTLVPKQDPHIRLWLKLNPDTVILEDRFTRDVRNVGHWGTGDLEIIIRNQNDFEKARLLIERSYQEN